MAEDIFWLSPRGRELLVSNGWRPRTLPPSFHAQDSPPVTKGHLRQSIRSAKVEKLWAESITTYGLANPCKVHMPLCSMRMSDASGISVPVWIGNGKWKREWTRCRVCFSQDGNCFAFQRQNLSLVCGLISVLKRSLKSIFLSLHGIIPLFSEKELSVYIWGWRLLLFWSNYENQYNTNNCNHNTSFQVRGTKRHRLSRPTRSGHWNKKRRLHPIIHLTYKFSSFLFFARNFMLFSKTVYK